MQIKQFSAKISFSYLSLITIVNTNPTVYIYKCKSNDIIEWFMQKWSGINPIILKLHFLITWSYYVKATVNNNGVGRNNNNTVRVTIKIYYRNDCKIIKLNLSPPFQSKLNCEVLHDDLAFEVRWAVAGDSIVLQLVAKLGKSLSHKRHK